MGTLTSFEIEQWNNGKGPRGKSNALCDGENLWLTRKSKTDPVWVLRYRLGNKRKEYTIGPHRVVGGLAGARNEALKLRARLLAGDDIAQTKRLVKLRRQTAMTYSELFNDYVSANMARLQPVTVREMRRFQVNDMVPKFGAIAVRDIKSQELVLHLRKIRDRSYTVARRLWEQLSVIFAHAVAIGELDIHPLASQRVASVLGHAPPKKPRIQLTREELAVVLERLPSQGEVNALAIKILFYSCVRKSELLQAKWEHLDLVKGLWHVPADIKGNKARRMYTIPLAPKAVAWFQRLKELAGYHPSVLPPQARHYAATNQTMSPATLNIVMIRISPGIRRFSPHDCRSTARSYLSELFPTQQLAIERALNHSLGGLVAVYDQSDYFDQRKMMLAEWANLLESFGQPGGGKVIPINSARKAS